MVPIIYVNKKSGIFFKIILNSILTALIILITMVVIKLCKLNPNTWTAFYVLALLFGITVPKKPNKQLERIIFAGLTTFSIQYSSDIFAIFSDDDVVKNEEVIYDALKEIKHPTLVKYLPKNYFVGEGYDNDEVIRNLKTHAVRIEKSVECYEKLTVGKNCSCLNSVTYAKFMIKKYSDLDKTPTMKISRPIILGDYFVHLFAKGSPYKKKFDKKYQQIFESGLQDTVYHGKKYLESYKLKIQSITFETKKSINHQLIVFMIGCVLATLIFIFEFLYFQIN